MDISEVAKRTGVPASTLRFYEKKGLLGATRTSGGRRYFAPNVLDQLALIALGQAGGLSLDEIHAMLFVGGVARVDRQQLLARADEIDATVKRLKDMSESLRHVAACPAESHADCPTFQRLLKAAAAGRLRNGGARPKVHGTAAEVR